MNFEIDISKRIAVISPSQAKILLTCPLRLVFSKMVTNYYPFLEHPAYILGSIIHEIIDRSYKRAINLEEFEIEWNRLFEIQQTKYFKNPLIKVNNPLEYWIPFYVVKKRMVEELIRNRMTLQKEDHRDKYNIHTEIDMEFEFLVGRIDYFYQNEEKIFIKDFKTGSINSFHKGKKAGVKVEYLEQLKTYGLIIKKKMEVSASSIYLSLLSIDGNESDLMSFSDDVYDQHYSTLKGKFQAIQNCKSIEDYQTLGEPSKEACNYCKYRPICINHKSELRKKTIQNNTDLYIDELNLRAGKNVFELSTKEYTIGGIPLENLLSFERFRLAP